MTWHNEYITRCAHTLYFLIGGIYILDIDHVMYSVVPSRQIPTIPPMGVANIELIPTVNMTIPNDLAIICCPNISANTTGIKPIYPPENKT